MADAINSQLEGIVKRMMEGSLLTPKPPEKPPETTLDKSEKGTNSDKPENKTPLDESKFKSTEPNTPLDESHFKSKEPNQTTESPSPETILVYKDKNLIDHTQNHLLDPSRSIETPPTTIRPLPSSSLPTGTSDLTEPIRMARSLRPSRP